MKFTLKLMILLCLISFSGCDETTEKESSNPNFKSHNGALSIGDLALFAYDKDALEAAPETVPYTLDIIEGQDAR